MSKQRLGGTMIARVVIIMLIAVLALPVATLTQPAETNPSPWGTVAADAKGKKPKKPRYKTVTRTVRQPVTETFTSIDPITIPIAPGGAAAQASPYPAAMTVSGFTNGTITDVNLGPNTFADPAPAPDGNVDLSTFDGADPNGVWQLWVMDAASIDVSDIDGGWSLQITAEVDVQVEEQVRIKDKQHKKKNKKRH